MEKMIVIFTILNNDTTQSQDLLIYMLIYHRSEAALRVISLAVINIMIIHRLDKKDSHHLDLATQIGKSPPLDLEPSWIKWLKSQQ